MKTNELKPCPYCGRENLDVDERYLQYDSEVLVTTVMCEDCEVIHRIDTWNTRPIEDGLQAEIERLNAKVAELESYKQLRNDIYANDASVLMGAPLAIEVVDRNTDRHFRMMSNWKLIKDDTGWEDTRRLIIDKFENWEEE